MQCPTCGKTIPDGSRHCAYCGAATQRLSRRRGWPVWVIPLLLLLGVGGGWALGTLLRPTPTPQVIEKAVTVMVTATPGVTMGASPTATPVPSARPGTTPEPLSTPVQMPELTATAAMATIEALTRVPTRTPTPTATNTPTPDATATMAVAFVRAVATATALGRDPADVYVNPKDLAVYLYVPAGEFIMGSKDDDPDADSDEKPQHTVTLDGFRIMQTEVTNEQYRKCVQDGACRAPTTCDWGEPTYADSSKADHPVVCVSWQDAQAYCEWTGKQLPTEAEWEKAARGSDGQKYPWGDSAPDCDKAQYSACGAGTVVVGSKPAGASPYGALDMAGNVWEWCQDWYGSGYYASSPQRDPQGPDSGESRVARGGSWYFNEGFVRAANRGGLGPDFHFDVGFRCVSQAP